MPDNTDNQQPQEQPVTAEQVERHRAEDAASSLAKEKEALGDKIEAIQGKQKDMGRGFLGSSFKMFGQALQSTTALLGQDKQRALQPVIVVTQMAAGLVSLFNASGDKRGLVHDLKSAQDKLAALAPKEDPRINVAGGPLAGNNRHS